jgi:hypothetical protein
MAGLVPAIHHFAKTELLFANQMDPRVKPAGDEFLLWPQARGTSFAAARTCVTPGLDPGVHPLQMKPLF